MIFDARERRFNFEMDLLNHDKVLPPFDDEIPCGSFAVVAYTATTYQSTAKKNDSINTQTSLGCNINWMVVLGTPK